MPHPVERRRRLPHLLTPRGRAALRALAADRALVAFDFDGTLAPIADHPVEARMTSRMRKLLAAVARLYPCAVISGRARRDLVRKLGRFPMVALAGSHGVEREGSSPEPPHSRIRRWAGSLRSKLRHVRGILLERKPHGLAVHYRRVEDKREARAAILAALTALEDVRFIHGDHVVEVLPADAPTKGDALTSLRRQLKPRATLYVGDDVTDEDAFESRGPGGLLAVRVGRAAATKALYRLDAQAEVEALMHALIAARRGTPNTSSAASRRVRAKPE